MINPEMPDNLNHALEGTILPTDYGVLSLGRGKGTGSIVGCYSRFNRICRKESCRKVAQRKNISHIAQRYDRIQASAFNTDRCPLRHFLLSVFQLPIQGGRRENIFEKTKGSQRKSGFMYQNSPESLIFLGGWSLNEDPLTTYGSENSVAGTVYKIGNNKAIMIFPTGENRVEIYELIK